MLYKLSKIKNFIINTSQPANIYIRRRYTNIFVTLTDFNHKVIVCKSAGSAGIKGNKRRKTTPQTVESIVVSLNYFFKRYNIKNIKLILKSKISFHMFSLIRYLSFFNVNITDIECSFRLAQGHSKKRLARRK